MTGAIDPAEWIEIGHYAVRCRSLLLALRICVALNRHKRIRNSGRMRGVDYMMLGPFRRRLEAQRA